MAKRDTKKTARYSVLAQEQSLDIAPHNSIKKAKAKERQEGVKEIDEQLSEHYQAEIDDFDSKRRAE